MFVDELEGRLDLVPDLSDQTQRRLHLFGHILVVAQELTDEVVGREVLRHERIELRIELPLSLQFFRRRDDQRTVPLAATSWNTITHLLKRSSRDCGCLDLLGLTSSSPGRCLQYVVGRTNVRLAESGCGNRAADVRPDLSSGKPPQFARSSAR
ncbi:hypothetical protein IVB41_32275 [Bradyrhizobium sp. 44]|uniref:hypothetical protein n=1 Tax=Bradyrhizobium sp. 40 TaxID=2782674 RepID=UPI001FFE35A1|nr:hypothetical protein [Bradyrhizobium sp. 40]MCK1288587.1 hypothetical protein [Bradyrhizobium sp. 44]